MFSFLLYDYRESVPHDWGAIHNHSYLSITEVDNLSCFYCFCCSSFSKRWVHCLGEGSVPIDDLKVLVSYITDRELISLAVTLQRRKESFVLCSSFLELELELFMQRLFMQILIYAFYRFLPKLNRSFFFFHGLVFLSIVHHSP